MPAPATEALLEADSVSVVYTRGDGTRVPALQRVSLRVERGEFLAVIGPSGCGKSTLLGALAGLIQPSQGEVRRAAHLSLGFLFQRETLLPWRRALGNVAAPLEARGVAKRQRLHQARQWLARLEVEGLAQRFPHELSGGQRQRVQLARTLVYDPDVIFMDEPLGSLDALTRAHIQEVLLDLHRSTPQTFVLVTHDLDEALSLADRVVVLRGAPGRVRGNHRVGWGRSSSVLAARAANGYTRLQRRLWGDLEGVANGRAAGVP